MSDNLQSELASARLRAEQEAFARAGIAQMEANRLQKQRDDLAKSAQMQKSFEHERGRQFHEHMQRQNEEAMRRIRQNAGTYPVPSHSYSGQTGTRPAQKASFRGHVTRLIVLAALLWGTPALVRFVHDRAGLTSSTRSWTRADGTLMREDTQYGMGGFTVTSDRSYPDPAQEPARRHSHLRPRSSRLRPNHRASHEHGR